MKLYTPPPDDDAGDDGEDDGDRASLAAELATLPEPPPMRLHTFTEYIEEAQYALAVQVGDEIRAAIELLHEIPAHRIQGDLFEFLKMIHEAVVTLDEFLAAWAARQQGVKREGGPS